MHAKSFIGSSALFVCCLIVSAFALPIEFSSPKSVALRAVCTESESKEKRAIEVGKAYAYLDGDLVRAGTVETATSECGAMVFTPFPDPVVSPENYQAAFLLEADLATLWRLQTFKSKQHVQKLAETFLSRLRERLKSAVASDVFKTRYEPRLWEIVNESIERTMEDEQIREGLKLATGELVELLGKNISPIMTDIFVKLGEKMASEMGQSLIFWLESGDSSMPELRKLFADLIKDPLIQRRITATMKEFGRSESAKTLGRNVVGHFFSDLSENERFAQLIRDALSDPDFLVYFDSLGDLAVNSMRQAAQVMLMKEDGKGLDPFAAVFLRSVVFQEERFYLLFASESQARSLDSSGLERVAVEKGGP